MAKLQRSVEEKIEGNQLESREEGKMWLVRHLEVIRRVMLEDLRIAKHHLNPCFPPRYNIGQHCISLYHGAGAKRLQDILEKGLEGQEYVSLLQGAHQTYPGPEPMGSPALGQEWHQVGPLLTDGSVARLTDSYRANRRKNLRHSQLATAKENLRHIFTVPETVAKTEATIEEGRLLQAHQNLVDLENSRDDLLFELHRLGHNNTRDRDLLKEYFEAVTDLSSKMEKQLGCILMRTFATVRKNPKELVSGLRIIEREEKVDEDCTMKQ